MKTRVQTLCRAVAAICVAVLAATSSARADTDTDVAAPVRITIECESSGRTKACPAFLLGFVDANAAMRSAPRSDTDVVLYVSTQLVANKDLLHLRFVGTVRGAPPVVEIDVALDPRTNDDAQRAALEPAFSRGISLFIGARFPSLVSVTLAAPSGIAAVPDETSPLGASLNFGGSGNWTDRYKSANYWGSFELTRITRHTIAAIWASANGALSRSPPLIGGDGTKYSLNTDSWNAATGAKYVTLLDRHWSIGAAASTWTGDDKGQYRYGVDAFTGLEWDRFSADDPRGNRLAISYLVGYVAEGYNLRNELGELDANYPKHRLTASGTMRRDKISYGLSVRAEGAMLRPYKRHSLSASPSITWQLGGHVDLSLSLSIAKSEVPGPDPAALDGADYELISRASYAEPVSASGSLDVTFHWDRTNAARNDRLSDF